MRYLTGLSVSTLAVLVALMAFIVMAVAAPVAFLVFLGSIVLLGLGAWLATPVARQKLAERAMNNVFDNFNKAFSADFDTAIESQGPKETHA